jgi:hypothetical protein
MFAVNFHDTMVAVGELIGPMLEHYLRASTGWLLWLLRGRCFGVLLNASGPGEARRPVAHRTWR